MDQNKNFYDDNDVHHPKFRRLQPINELGEGFIILIRVKHAYTYNKQYKPTYIKDTKQSGIDLAFYILPNGVKIRRRNKRVRREELSSNYRNEVCLSEIAICYVFVATYHFIIFIYFEIIITNCIFIFR